MTTATAAADFERMYQQAYYLHSGFPQQEPVRAPRRSFSPMPTLLPGLAFAGLALVMFVVPAAVAALVI